MKPRMKLSPATKVSTRTTVALRYAAAGISIFLFLFAAWYLFFQMGQQEDALASGGASAPANDAVADAIMLNSRYQWSSNDAAYSNADATADAFSGSCFSGSSDRGVWFRFKAVYADATVQVNTGGQSGTISDLEVAIFDSNMTQIQCATTSGNSDINLTLTGLTTGMEYLVLVNSPTGSEGTFSLYFNNVSPTIYYTRNKGNWTNTSTWSTSGYSGGSAGSTPGPEHVVMISDLDGELKVNANVTCATIIIEGDNDKSTVKVDGNKTLTVQGDLQMTMGSGDEEIKLEVDNGILNIAGDLLVDKANGNDPAVIDFDDATVTVGQSFITYLKGGSDGLEIDIKGGSQVDVAGDMTLHRTGGSGDQEFKIEESATLAVAGDVLLEMIAGNNKMELFVFDHGSMTVGGNFDIYQKGGSNLDVDVYGNGSMTIAGDMNAQQTGGSAPLSVTVGVNNSSQFGTLVVMGNLRFGATQGSSGNHQVELEVKRASTLRVGRNIEATNGKGKFSFSSNGDSYLELIGSAPQTIVGESSGELEVDYQFIEINNTYAPAAGDSANYYSVLVTGNITVQDELKLTQGIVRTEATSVITMSNGATITGGSSTAYIDGPLVWEGAGTRFFPVGKNAVYAPAELSNYSSSSSSVLFRAEYFYQPYEAAALGTGLSHVSKVEHWKIERMSGGSEEARITLFWYDNQRSGITDLSDLGIGVWDGTQWNSAGTTSLSGTLEAGEITTDTRPGSYSGFTLASIGGGNVLPITLNLFDAALQYSGAVKLNWETAMELNNDFFSIERSSDGKSFTELLTVQGAGTSYQPNRYVAYDEQPMPGINVYRLKQTDYDGNFTYFPLREVDNPVEPVQDFTITNVFPNPFGEQVMINFHTLAEGMAQVEVVSAAGQAVFRNQVRVTGGQNTMRLNAASWQPGMYLLTITMDNQTAATARLMKAR